MFNLWAYLDSGRRDLADVAIDVELSNSLDQLGASLTFSLPWSDQAGKNIASPTLGDTISLVSYIGINGGLVFSGVVTDVENQPDRRKITCHDFCWYLNKTKVTIQFSGVSVTEAIRALWDECGISVSRMAKIETIVSETCYCETPAGILNKLLTEAENDTGKRYYAYAEQGNRHVINVEQVGADKTHGVFTEIVSPTKKLSLDDVVNHAVYISGDSSGYYDTGVSAEDAESIAKYGRITDLIIAEEEDISAQKIVETRVRSKSTPKATATLEGAGWFPRPGQRIDWSDSTVDASGEWVVEEMSVKWSGGEARLHVQLSEYTEFTPYEEAVAEEVATNVEASTTQTLTNNGNTPPKNYDGLVGDLHYVKY